MLIATTTLIALTVWAFFKEYSEHPNDFFAGLLCGLIAVAPPWGIGVASGYILMAVLAL